jgi:hypothetical protein
LISLAQNPSNRVQETGGDETKASEQQPKAKSKADDFFAELKASSSVKKPTLPTMSMAAKSGGGGLASIMSGLVSVRPSTGGAAKISAG